MDGHSTNTDNARTFFLTIKTISEFNNELIKQNKLINKTGEWRKQKTSAYEFLSEQHTYEFFPLPAIFLF